MQLNIIVWMYNSIFPWEAREIVTFLIVLIIGTVFAYKLTNWNQFFFRSYKKQIMKKSYKQ